VLGGRVLATILVDGFVAGTWRIERARKAVTLVIAPFERLAPDDRDALEREGGASSSSPRKAPRATP
jgi:uncharacterized membrane protein YqjE